MTLEAFRKRTQLRFSPPATALDRPSKVSRFTFSPDFKPRTSPRLIFDEQLSKRVAAALKELGAPVTAVGLPGAPPKGTTDTRLIEWSVQQHRLIVTDNHDLMMIAPGLGGRFIWLDPRGKKYSLLETVHVVFRQLEAWTKLAELHPDLCIRAGRTSCEAIEAPEAARLAGQRYANRLRKRNRSKRAARARDAQQQSLDL